MCVSRRERERERESEREREREREKERKKERKKEREKERKKERKRERKKRGTEGGTAVSLTFKVFGVAADRPGWRHGAKQRTPCETCAIVLAYTGRCAPQTSVVKFTDGRCPGHAKREEREEREGERTK